MNDDEQSIKNYAISMTAEIRPSLKYIKDFFNPIPIIFLITFLLFIAQSDFLSLFVSNAYADTFIWRHVDREQPISGRLVWIDHNGVCRHLARFDARSGRFYDNQYWVHAEKWVYIFNDKVPALRPCTSEDLP